MACAAPTVTKSTPSLVPPAGPTPDGSLPLSSIDKTAAVRVSVDFIQVFPEVGKEGASSATMSKVEMDAKFGVPTSNAVIGMMGLRDAMRMLRERRENVEGSGLSMVTAAGVHLSPGRSGDGVIVGGGKINGETAWSLFAFRSFAKELCERVDGLLVPLAGGVGDGGCCFRDVYVKFWRAIQPPPLSKSEQRSWAPLSHQTNYHFPFLPGLRRSAPTHHIAANGRRRAHRHQVATVAGPAGGANPGGSLPLSSIDKTAAVRVSVDFIQVFPEVGKEGASSAIATMREGFAKALVPYYPVAGRIAEPVQGEPEIECTGEGCGSSRPRPAARSRRRVTSSGRCASPRRSCSRALRPRFASRIPCSSLRFQYLSYDVQGALYVTKFTCGGLAVGICFSHLVFDGQGAAQFLKTVGEMARGSEPSIKPVWARDAIPNPPKPPLGPPPSFTAFNFEKSVVEISLDSIKRVKDQVASETNQKCSTFDVVTAIIFKCRALAIDFAPDAEVRLGFAASTRHLLNNVLPSVEGYYGNCVDAKEALSTRFLDWLSGGAKENHYNVSLDYGTLVVTDWSHVGFNEVDYGFGEPSYVFTLNDDVNIVPSVVYLKPPKPKQGIRLVLQCVEPQHSAVFSEELQKLA
ncbi:hypothetical protein EJB05_17857, partial [Eragrostis curvula]